MDGNDALEIIKSREPKKPSEVAAQVLAAENERLRSENQLLEVQLHCKTTSLDQTLVVVKRLRKIQGELEEAYSALESERNQLNRENERLREENQKLVSQWRSKDGLPSRNPE